MKAKAKIKIVIDIVMTLALLFVNGYQLWGDVAHEWVGTGLFLLFIAHHLLNIGWYKNLFSGKYTLLRVFGLVVNLLVLASMLIQMYSAIVLSRHVFTFLPIGSGLALARRLHILGAFWGFLLMGLHLGLHWGVFLGLAKKSTGIKHASKLRAALCFCIGLLIAAYGVFVFIDRDFVLYLFLQSEFVFLDYNESPLLFYIDYLSLMGLCIFASHYLARLCKYINRRRRKKK